MGARAGPIQQEVAVPKRLLLRAGLLLGVVLAGALLSPEVRWQARAGPAAHRPASMT
jgi:hypothetical protein